MPNIIPFKKISREFRYTGECYLWLILKGLSQMFGDDDLAKTEYIKENCPQLSMMMLERFQKQVSTSCQEYYRLKKASN